MRVVYSPNYNIAGYGIEKLHPFDGRKFGRAWEAILAGAPAAQSWLSTPAEPMDESALQRVHSAEYLQELRSAAYLAQVFEVPQAKWIPAFILDQVVLSPMRWATAGTLLAAREALAHGLAVNLGGGYHHAKPASGEGFNAYNDVAIAVAALRAAGQLADDDALLYVDGDAHQGNGVCHCFLSDRRFKIFDIFNSLIYPAHDTAARDRIDRPVPLLPGASGDQYLLALERNLTEFLDALLSVAPPRLAFYNAGSDVHTDDPLGGLSLRDSDVLERDVRVIEQLRKRQIPVAMVLGGGYTKAGYRLVADSVLAIGARWAA